MRTEHLAGLAIQVQCIRSTTIRINSISIRSPRTLHLAKAARGRGKVVVVQVVRVSMRWLT